MVPCKQHFLVGRMSEIEIQSEAKPDTKACARRSDSERIVQRELVGILFKAPHRILVNIAVAALLLPLAWPVIPHGPLLVWFALVAIAVFARCWLYAAFSRRQPSPEESERWGSWFFIGSLTSACLWGASAGVLWLTPDITYHVLLAFVVAGMTAAAVTTNYAHLPSSYGFVLGAAAPLCIAFLAQGSLFYVVMGAMGVIFIVFLIAHARISHGVLINSLRLQMQNALLVDDLSAAKMGLEERVQERTLELEAANRSLQAEITTRTAAEEKLRHAQKMEAVGQLTGGVAHDFNNLLAVIKGNAETLMKFGEMPDDDRLAAIVRSADRGAELTNRLLAFSRRQKLQPTPVNLDDLIAGMRSMLARTLGENIEIEWSPNENPGLACIDAGQLENALLNLVINARDSMPQGGRVTIETANVDLGESDVAGHDDARPGSYVMLTVCDAGMGIPKNHLNRVFEPFFTTKDVGAGSGLGLSMVYGFVTQSGGHVSIESGVGKGTTVRLYLPRFLGDSSAVRPAPGIGDSMPGGNEALLVLEDDPDVRAFAAGLLGKLGYRVWQAEDGMQALSVLEQHGEIALVVTDVILPSGMSGPDFIQKALRLIPRLKAVYISGYAPEAHKMKASSLNEEAEILMKPFRTATLAQAIRSALDDEA